MRISPLPCAVVALAAISLAGCGDKATTLEDYNTRPVTLPNGKVIKAESLVKPEDMMRGMMFRDSLAADRGMLFFHTQPGKYGYWMYQCKFPLDIIWMDSARKVVEISANTPPCPSKSAKECPTFGGHEEAKYVLELNGGAAAQNGVKVGSILDF
jgi:uncharacterized membrane protein (UPF0127 family)